MKQLFFVLMLLFAAPSMAGQAAYFSALPELPVATGMAEVPGTAVRFDQPEGRIIVLQAVGRASVNDIKAFYHNTLPALGWQEKGENRFVRKGDGQAETLLLETRVDKGKNGAGTRLNVLVRPE